MKKLKKPVEQPEPLVLKERERCGQCVKAHMTFVTDPVMKSVLVRIENQIRSGTLEPSGPQPPSE